MALRANLLALVLMLVVAAALSGCRTSRLERLATYPIEITDLGSTPNFPLRIGSYVRGGIFAYRPGLLDVSIAYDCLTNDLQNAVTLYFAPVDFSFEQQYALEKNGVQLTHPGARLVEERQITLNKNGVSYRAQIASFVFQAMFAGQEQALISQLVLSPLPDHYLKVRSTAPLTQADLAESSMLRLVESVGWSLDKPRARRR